MEYFVAQVAELWIVARCNCAKLRSWRSQNHLDCLFVEPWITDQIKVIADNVMNKKGETLCEENKESPNYCESLDSLQTETTTTFDKLSFLPRLNLLPTNLVICLLITPMISAIILFACGKGRSPGVSNGKRNSKKQQSKVPRERLSSRDRAASKSRNVASAERSTQIESSKKETTTSNSDKSKSKLKKLKSQMLAEPDDQMPRKVKKGSSKNRPENPSQEQQSEREKTKSAGAAPPPLSPGRGETSKEQPPTKYENADKVASNNNNEPSSSSAAAQQKEGDKPSPYEPLSPAGSELDVRMSDVEASKKEKERLQAVADAAAGEGGQEQPQQNDESGKGKDAEKKDDNEDDEEEKSDSKKEKKKSKKKSKKKKKKKDKKSKKKKKSKKLKKESEKEKQQKVDGIPALAPTQYENLYVYPHVLNEPKPSKNDKRSSFMSKMNQNVTGATATEDMGFEVTTDTYLTGVNPRRLKAYLNQKGPTMLTGYENEDGGEKPSAAPRSLKLEPTMQLSVKEPLETAKPKSEMTELQLQQTQEFQASRIPTATRQLDKTQEYRYFENAEPASLSTTQEMKPMLQKTQTHVETTQRGDGTVTTQRTRTKLTTGIEGEATGLPRSETQEAESTQTLAKVASLTPIETTQRTTHNQIGETQPTTKATTKATQKTQTVFPLVTALDNEKPLNNDYQSLTMPSSEHQQQQLPGARITLNEHHSDKKYPKPKVFPKNDKEQKIAKYGLKARNDEYPTFKDIASDWGTEALDERTAKASAGDDFLKSKNEAVENKKVKNDASDKKKKSDAPEKKKKGNDEAEEAEREAKRAAEEERIRKLRANAPKPKVLKRNSWEEKIAEGKVFRRKQDYPTMNDVVSDWESKDSSEHDSKDPPPRISPATTSLSPCIGSPAPTSYGNKTTPATTSPGTLSPCIGSPGPASSGWKTSPAPSTRPGTGIPKKGSLTKSKAAHDDL